MQIHKAVTDNGGVYVKDLDRNSTITHLLCGEDEGDDDAIHKGRVSKKHFIQKLNEANDTKIQVVWEEWLWDSLSLGGKFGLMCVISN